MENWDNSINKEFYEKVPYESLTDYAVKGGIDNGCDIELAFPYIEKTKSIIEIGAGYGRVIKKLIQKEYNGKIYAIERSKNLFNILNKSFTSNVVLINDDIQNYIPVEKVEAIMWMWSSISDFPKNDQSDILKKLTSWLTDDGIIVLETILHTTKPNNVSKYCDQSYVSESPYGKAYGYIPSSEEIKKYAFECGFLKIKHIDYITARNRKRILHILKKS